jgi:hypothetical protein
MAGSHDLVNQSHLYAAWLNQDTEMMQSTEEHQDVPSDAGRKIEEAA